MLTIFRQELHNLAPDLLSFFFVWDHPPGSQTADSQTGETSALPPSTSDFPMSTQQEARRRGGSIEHGGARDEALLDPTGLPDAAIIPKSVTPGAILTLRDNPILPVNHVALRSTRKPALLPTALGSDSDGWDGDVLEDTASRAKGRSRKQQNAMPYDPTDNAQFVDGTPKYPATTSTERIAQSVERPNSLLFESDYHLPPVASIPKRQRRLRKKRRRERTSTFAEGSTIPVAPVSRGHVDALRKAIDNQETRGHVDIKNDGSAASDFQNDNGKDVEIGDGDDDGDDDHYNALLRSRKRTQQVSVKSSVNKILDAINDANEDGMQDDIQDSAYERGAKILSTEMRTFLREDVLRPVAADAGAGADVIMRDDTVERDSKNRSDFTNVKNTKSEAEENKGNLTAAANRGPWKGQDSGASEHHNVKGMKEEDVVDLPLSSNALENNGAEKSEAVEEGTGMTGLAGTLKRLREMGQLTKKNEQIGRAKDRRAYDDDDSDKDDFGNNGSHKTNVKLSYLDDTGNELTPKEAFRLLCHKFHGNAPGKNKNEKRLKKMLEQMRVRNMRTDDTPLASAAALKEETRKLKTPHVVVSGVEGFKNSTAEDATSQAEPTESDDVKNRFVEPKVEFTIGRANNPLKRRRVQPAE